MTEPLYLLFGIHHHQPVGNFDQVFEEAFAKCYRPLLEMLERHPGVTISLHHSGPLLDWAAARERDYLKRLEKLVAAGRIEILGGGYYEPILPILKPSDALGQIEMMQRFWEERTGKRPAGMWLAERVWEPSIASLMNEAGMRYTILDDQHFRHAGITDETLFDYYRTERAGRAIAIFPTDKTLRYLIPFRTPSDVIDHLLSLQHRFPGCALTYGDDGEKFGLWPGTYDWVIKEGWLDKFFAGLEAHADRIRTTTFSAFMESHPARQTVYLPTASYSEMLEWAMPPEAIRRYESARRAMEHAGIWEQAAPFFRGGFWDNFLTKYPEGNLIHKRAIRVSNRIDAAEAALGRKLPEARAASYRAQCNCAYWHGLFGGIYLNYLRHALYHNLIDADIAVDESLEKSGAFTRAELSDVDLCGEEEAVLTTRELSLMVKPGAGGGIIALDWRPARFNLLNTFARRQEAYHVPEKQEHHGGGGSGVASIHDIGKDISQFAELLVVDRAPRAAFVDHAFGSEPDWHKFDESAAYEIGDLAHLHYRLIGKPAAGEPVAMEGSVELPSGSMTVRKEISLKGANAFAVRYRLKLRGVAVQPVWFATEFNFTLLAGHDHDRFYQWGDQKPGQILMDARRVIEKPGTLCIVDRAFGFSVKLHAAAEKVLLSPVETISQSESGFDRIHQGSVAVLGFRPAWSKEGTADISVDVELAAV